MDLTPGLISDLANIGISVMFAVVLLSLYTKQTRGIIDLTERWTERLAEVAAESTRAIEQQTAVMREFHAAMITLQMAVTQLCEEVRRRTSIAERS